MTTTQTVAGVQPASRKIAAEIRAELGRQGASHRRLAGALGVSYQWVNRRISVGADQPLTFEEVDRIAEILGVPTGRIIAASGWLPRLDSNQQPFGYAPTRPARPVVPTQRTAA